MLISPTLTDVLWSTYSTVSDARFFRGEGWHNSKLAVKKNPIPLQKKNTSEGPPRRGDKLKKNDTQILAKVHHSYASVHILVICPR